MKIALPFINVSVPSQGSSFSLLVDNKKIACVGLLLSFFPYLSPLPLPTDVQPVFFVFAGLVLLLSNNSLRFSRFDILFGWLAIFSLFYLDLQSTDRGIFKAFGLFFAWIAYVFFRNWKHLLSQKLLFGVIVFHLFGLLLNYLSIDLFMQVFGRFLSRVSVTEFTGIRGPSGLTPEPSFIGVLSVFFLALSFYIKDQHKDTRFFRSNVAISIAMVVFSASASGLLALFLFLGFRYAYMVRKHIFLTTFVASIGIFSLQFLDLGRFTALIDLLLQNPELLLQDESLGMRVANILVGLLIPLQYPFGMGGGAFLRAYGLIESQTDFTAFIATITGNVSAFSLYSIELGLLFWGLLIALFFKGFGVKGFGKTIPFKMLALFMISGSFSILFPPIWFLFALTDQHPVLSSSNDL